MAGLISSRWNQICPSLLNTFEQLKKLGFTYYNGEISVIPLMHSGELPQIEEVSDD